MLDNVPRWLDNSASVDKEGFHAYHVEHSRIDVSADGLFVVP